MVRLYSCREVENGIGFVFGNIPYEFGQRVVRRARIEGTPGLHRSGKVGDRPRRERSYSYIDSEGGGTIAPAIDLEVLLQSWQSRGT